MRKNLEKPSVIISRISFFLDTNRINPANTPNKNETNDSLRNLILCRLHKCPIIRDTDSKNIISKISPEILASVWAKRHV